MLVLDVPTGGGVKVGEATIRVEQGRGGRIRMIFDADRSIAIQRGRHVRQVGDALVLEFSKPAKNVGEESGGSR